MKKVLRGLLLMAAAVPALVPAAYAEELLVIRNRQLLVDGKPFLALGGELHNSSASSPDHMQPVWGRLQAMHVRTVSWEDFEPTEDHYDDRLVDAQIAQARQHGIRLVVIWFGNVKNASPTYAPS